jgi:hypothetical protein
LKEKILFFSTCLARSAREIISETHKSVVIFCFIARYRDLILKGLAKYHRLVTFSFIA